MVDAIRLAKKGLFSTDPNPRVGCIISRDDTIIGSGWHRQAGGAHAEVMAIESIGGGGLVGATVYVTLEPCAHYGRTPPCCEALLRAQVARVVVAMQDPNPVVAGSGIDYLRGNGVQVECGLLQREAHELNPGFISRMTRKRPWVRVKLASSIDGRTALDNGKSRWITGCMARLDGHKWRARSSCILTGSGTVRMDNPTLNVRMEPEIDGGSSPTFRQPLRAIIDSRQTTDPAAKIFSATGKTLIFSATDNGKYAHLSDVSVHVSDRGTSGKLDLASIMQYLAENEINEVHVEAGAGLCGALLQANLLDELIVYQAAIVLGSSAKGLFDLPRLTDMSEKIPFVFHDMCRLGNDIRLIFRPTEQH